MMPRLQCMLSVDVEDWFHILDSPAVPPIERWGSLECRVARNVERLLEIFDRTDARATFFWLGWTAERHKQLVRRCKQAGHEIASHGYAHLLAYKAGCRAFGQDVTRAKCILEDIIGEKVLGFRAGGFGITDEATWAFEVIRRAGHQYDSSVFPASRGHGGMPRSPLGCYVISTPAGSLVEWPMSVVEVLGHRISLFGGGYLRLAPKWMIRWGAAKLRGAGRPMVVYIHPREIDPQHPRLPLSLTRRFKSYVALGGTAAKLRWLCREYDFHTMGEMAALREDLHLRPPTLRATATKQPEGSAA